MICYIMETIQNCERLQSTFEGLLCRALEGMQKQRRLQNACIV